MGRISASLALSSFKYAYLTVFFLLLTSLFQTLVFERDGDRLAGGFFILSLGLLGGILLWQSAHGERNRIPYMAGGFGMVGASLYLMYQII